MLLTSAGRCSSSARAWSDTPGAGSGAGAPPCRAGWEWDGSGMGAGQHLTAVPEGVGEKKYRTERLRSV